MTTAQDLINIIKDDFDRGDIDSQILNAINSAHRHYQVEQTWFNESTASLSTSSGQAAYTTADGVPQYIIKLRLVELTHDTSNVFPLRPLTFEEFKTINTSPTTTLGVPGDYTWYNNTLLLYTTPDREYPVHLYYHKGYGALSAGATTEWLDNAQDLIECRASYLVASRVTMEPERAQSARMLEIDALQKLRERTTAMLQTSHVRDYL